MKSLMFALASLTVGIGSSVAQAQCHCGGGCGPIGIPPYQPVYANRATFGWPISSAWPTAPMYVPASFGGCRATGLVYAPAMLTPTAPGMTGMTGMNMKGTNVTAADPAPTKAEGKQVKLMGTLVCGKCNLHQTKKCSNVLQVKEGGKTVNYWLADKGNGETYHAGVCGGGKVEHVTVTGAMTEKDGKMVITPTKVDVKK